MMMEDSHIYAMFMRQLGIFHVRNPHKTIFYTSVSFELITFFYCVYQQFERIIIVKHSVFWMKYVILDLIPICMWRTYSTVHLINSVWNTSELSRAPYIKSIFIS